MRIKTLSVIAVLFLTIGTQLNALTRAEKKLIDTIKYGKINKVEKLLSRGVNVNARDDDGVTGLILAASRGEEKYVELLLNYGADIEMRENEYGMTAFWAAAIIGNRECLELLIRKGADVNTKDNEGYTILENTIVSSTECLKVLLRNGVQANAKNKKGTTALMQVVRTEREMGEYIEVLIKNGADVNARNDDGWTALMIAAASGIEENLKTLIQSGADINARDDVGWTALIMAATIGKSKKCLEILLQNGADVNVEDTKGNTTLMLAAQQGTREIVKTLLRNGADINLKNRLGQTAVDTAQPSIRGLLLTDAWLIKNELELSKKWKTTLDQFYFLELADRLLERRESSLEKLIDHFGEPTSIKEGEWYYTVKEVDREQWRPALLVSGNKFLGYKIRSNGQDYYVRELLPDGGVRTQVVPASISEKWAQLKKGMSPNEVSVLLGIPPHFEQTRDSLTWGYPFGEVTFEGASGILDSEDGELKNWKRKW